MMGNRKMGKYFLALAMGWLWIAPNVIAQVKIGTPAGAPHPSAVLELQTNSRGLLPPRLTPRERENIANPAEGLVVYDLTEKALMLYNGNQWETLGPALESTGVLVVDAAGSGNFTTITAALASVNPTAAQPAFIYVKPGTYNEHLVMKSHVTLRGASVSGVRLEGKGIDGTQVEEPAIEMNNLQNVYLERMTIFAGTGNLKANVGISLQQSKALFDDIIIVGDRDFQIRSLKIGISAFESEFNFRNGKMMEITDEAVKLAKSTANISGCTLQGFINTIDVRQGSFLSLSGSHHPYGAKSVNIENGGVAHIYGNTFDSVSGAVTNHGRLQFVANVVTNTDNAPGVSNFNEATITGNRFFFCRPYAIFESSGGRAVISGNLIEQSAEVGTQAISNGNSAAVYVGNIFRNNTAGDMSVSGTAVPMLIGTEGQINSLNTLRVGLAGNGPVKLERIGSHLVTALQAGGNVGIGRTDPQHKLHIEDATATRGIYVDHTAATGTRYGVWARSAAISGTGLRGDATHATGVTYGVYGTTASGAGSGVYAEATAATGTTYGAYALAASTAGRALYGYATANSGTNYGVYGRTNSATGYAGYFQGGRNYFQGNVGIGIAAPTVPLHIQSGNQELRFTATEINQSTGGNLLLKSASQLNMEAGGSMQISAEGAASLSGGTNLVLSAPQFIRLNNLLNVTATSGVGIATTNPGAFLLAVNGSAAKTGGGSWSVFSDARLKQNIQKIETGMLEKLLSLNTYQFEYKPQAIEHNLAQPGRQIGLLAQEVQQVFPEWVDADKEGYLYITERSLTAIMSQALRELRAEKDEQLEALHIMNRQLMERLERLEKKVY